MSRGRQVAETKRLSSWLLLSIVVVLFIGSLFAEPMRAYYFSVVSHWIASMSGVVSVAIGLFERAKKKLDARVFYLVAGLCLFIACFQAWQDVRRSSADLQDKLNNRQPNFGLELSGAVIGPTKKNSTITVIVLMGRIKNSGAASLVENWKMELRTEGKEIEGTIFAAPSASTVVHLQPKSNMVIFGSDYWTRKIDPQHPVISGAGVDGWIAALFPGVDYDHAYRTHATVELSAEDITGRTYYASYTFVGIEKTPQFLEQYMNPE
jgi:hypothetical protein